MKRICTALLLLLWVGMAWAIERSTNIVFINGTKYYIHAVQAGETLYALAKAYGVSEEAITASNVSAREGLKAGERIKIPLNEAEKAQADSRSERKLKKTFSTHFVAKGETLYSIARRYEISVETVLEDNPDLDPTHLKLGERILIRKKAIGKSDAAETREQIEEYNAQLNSVAAQGEQYYVVQKGDTFYSLSRRNGITEQELSELNDGLQPHELKAGAIIKLRAEATTPNEGTPQSADRLSEGRIEPEKPHHVEIDFRAHCDCDPLQVALLLPMGTPERPNDNYVEFYRGFLMGLDSVRTRYGHSVELNLYNTRRDTARISEIVADEAFRRAQLIVGPVYEEELGEVVRFAEQKQVPVVSPLAQLPHIKSDVLFEMAPDPKEKYRKAESLVDSVQRITLIYTENTDKNFEAEILELLRDRPYEKHTYKYVHPSVKFPEDEPHPSDLSPIMTNDESNLFIIMADNELDVDRILAALASAETNLRARSLAKPHYVVLGNSRWNRYTNIDRTIFFRNRVIFFSTYHAKRDQQVVERFDQAHIRAFGSLPTLYTYRGYDAAMIFVNAMYNDIAYDLEDRRYEPLGTFYRFKQEKPTENHRNRNWMRVNYNSNFTITVE